MSSQICVHLVCFAFVVKLTASVLSLHVINNGDRQFVYFACVVCSKQETPHAPVHASGSRPWDSFCGLCERSSDDPGPDCLFRRSDVVVSDSRRAVSSDALIIPIPKVCVIVSIPCGR